MAERKTIWKLFFVWNYEKEERWLNEMAMSGWALVHAAWPGRFTFEACEPGEYIIRMEILYMMVILLMECQFNFIINLLLIKNNKI